jgi:hypothetical protein
MVGIYYGVCTFTYFITSLFENKISRCCNSRLTIIFGTVGVFFSFLLIGPWIQVIPFDLIPVVVGLGGLGVAGAFMYSKKYLVPTTGLIIQLSTDVYHLKYDDRLLDSISAFTNFFCNVGEFSGPFLAGFLSEEIGFSNGCSVVAVTTLGFCMIYITISCWCKAGEQLENKKESAHIIIKTKESVLPSIEDLDLQIKSETLSKSKILPTSDPII